MTFLSFIALLSGNMIMEDMLRIGLGSGGSPPSFTRAVVLVPRQWSIIATLDLIGNFANGRRMGHYNIAPPVTLAFRKSCKSLWLLAIKAWFVCFSCRIYFRAKYI